MTMHIRTFQAQTLQEALAEIRRQMGSDAVVLHTRDVHRGIFGLLGRSHVEVTAGLKPISVAPTSAPSRSLAKSVESPPSRDNADQVKHLSEQVNRLSMAVQSLQQRDATATPSRGTQPQSDSNPNARIADALVELGIDLLNANWIASEVTIAKTTSDEDLIPVLRQTLRKRFRIAGPIDVPQDQQRVVALVGPTGVGKTTTIAKLAAGFRLVEKRKVGLITIDTFRIAAVDQLHKYAQVMQLPMEVVSGGEQMRTAMHRLSDVDLVLIDTIGRSPRDTRQLELTRQLLGFAKPHETHLVLSATASRAAIQSAVENYAVLRPGAIIISKLDEIEQQPDLLSFTTPNVPAISYVTTGQKVPDDIDIPQPSRLVNLMIGIPDDVGGRRQAIFDEQQNNSQTLVDESLLSRRDATAMPEASEPKPSRARNLLLPSDARS